MVELIRLEVVRDPGLTFCVQGRRSSHLTLTNFNMVELSGIEPLTSCVQGRRSPS